jgi:hypothetical protein
MKTVLTDPVYPNFHFSDFTGKRALNFLDIDIEVEGLKTVHDTAVLAVEMGVSGVMLARRHAIEQASAPPTQSLNQFSFHQQFQDAIHGDPVDIHGSTHHGKDLLGPDGRRIIPDHLHNP